MSKQKDKGNWEDETARERTGHLLSYAMAKKMKSPALDTCH